VVSDSQHLGFCIAIIEKAADWEFQISLEA